MSRPLDREHEELAKAMAGLSRREFMTKTAAVGTAAVVSASLVGCGADTTGTTDEGSLEPAGKVVGPQLGGVWDEALTDCVRIPFTEATGIECAQSGEFIFATLKAQVESGNVEWDYHYSSMSYLLRGVLEDLLQPLDYSIIDAKTKTTNQMHPFGIGIYHIGEVLTWRTDVFPEDHHPSNWADFWNVDEFPGPRGLMNDPIVMLEVALLADGVPMEELYPLDEDRAFASLERIKPHVTVWWEGGTESQELIRTSEVVTQMMWANRAAQLRMLEPDLPMDLTWYQGCLHNASHVFIPKGAPHPIDANMLIDYWGNWEPQKCFAEQMGPGPSNLNAYEHMTPEVMSLMNTAPENARLQFRLDEEWWARNEERVLERWQEFLAG